MVSIVASFLNSCFRNFYSNFSFQHIPQSINTKMLLFVFSATFAALQETHLLQRAYVKWNRTVVHRSFLNIFFFDSRQYLSIISIYQLTKHTPVLMVWGRTFLSSRTNLYVGATWRVIVRLEKFYQNLLSHLLLTSAIIFC